jgi:DNA-binding response OmpR family regulator
MKVLVIDPDPGAQIAYAAITRSGGWTALGCKDTSAAIDLINRERIDVLILGQSSQAGLEMLRSLRLAGIELRAILITAVCIDRREARKLGVEAILPKPPDVSDLRSVLSALEEDADLRNPDFVAIFRFLDHCNELDLKQESRSVSSTNRRD